MFEKATRMKLRFQHKGIQTVEDLWDLSVQELDKIFQALKKESDTTAGESLLQTDKKDDIIELKISIIRYIVKVKLQETEDHENEIIKKEKREQILRLIQKKADAELEDLSIEELKKMI